MTKRPVARLIVASTVACAALFGVVACGTATPSANKYDVVEVNGIECVVYNTGNAGGISCNWEKYNEAR